MIGSGGGEKDAVAMKHLAHQIERPRQLVAALTRHAHSPRDLGKTELLGKTAPQTPAR